MRSNSLSFIIAIRFRRAVFPLCRRRAAPFSAESFIWRNLAELIYEASYDRPADHCVVWSSAPRAFRDFCDDEPKLHRQKVIRHLLSERVSERAERADLSEWACP